MLKLPFYFVGAGDSLRKWLLQKLMTRYMHISITHLLYISVNTFPYSSSVSESFVPTVETTKQLVEEFRDTLNVDTTMTEKVCYLLLLEAHLSHAF